MNMHEVKSRTTIMDLSVLFIICILMVLYSWTGYHGQGDRFYATAAINWIDSFPYVGDSHWALRNPLVLSISVFFRLFGVNEISLVLPSILSYVTIVLISYLFVKRIADRKAGVISSLLLSTSPLFAVGATICKPDIIEALLLASSIMIFYYSTLAENNRIHLFLAGIILGLAWTNRVTAIGLIPFYFVLFVMGFGIRRTSFLYLILGFISVVALELFTYWIIADNPLHRIITMWQTHSTASIGRSIGTGNFITDHINWGVLNPFLILLFNDEFLLLFWTAIPLIIFGFASKLWQSDHKRIFFHLAILIIIWFVFISYMAPLRRLPRYYNMSVMAACMATGITLSYWFNRAHTLPILVLVILVSSNMLGIYLKDKNPLFAERALVEAIQRYAEPIYTDPQTVWKSSFLFQASGKSVKTSEVSLIPYNSLYFFNPDHVLDSRMPIIYNEKDFSQKYTPMAEWDKIETIKPKRKLLDVLLDNGGLGPYVPEIINRKFLKPNKAVYLYRTKKNN